jgi:hypothetical protein
MGTNSEVKYHFSCTQYGLTNTLEFEDTLQVEEVVDNFRAFLIGCGFLSNSIERAFDGEYTYESLNGN